MAPVSAGGVGLCLTLVWVVTHMFQCDSYINKTTTAVTHLCSLVKRVCIVNLCVVSLCIVNKPWLLLKH